MTTDDKPAPVHLGTLLTSCGLDSEIDQFTGTWTLSEVTCEACMDRSAKRAAAKQGRREEPASAPVEYDSVQRPMGGYFILAPNGSLTPVTISPRLREFVPMSVGYEEEAMDPVKPAPHPAPNLAPWRWEEKDGRRWLVDENGHPVPTGRIVGDKIVDSHESELQRAAPEMARLLREWNGYSGWVHSDCDCLYCRTMRVLARIDAAARAG